MLTAAMVGTAFFVMALLSTQDPWAVGGTLFLVTAIADGFGVVNPGVDLGNFIAITIDGGEAGTWYYGFVGSVLGAFIGWAIKDNLLD